MTPDVFAKDHPRVIGKAPGQVKDCLASLESFSNAFPIGQIPLQVLDALDQPRPGGPVEDPDFILLPGIRMAHPLAPNEIRPKGKDNMSVPPWRDPLIPPG